MIKSSVAEKLRTCAKSPCGYVFDRMREEFGTCCVSDFCNKVADKAEEEEAELRDFCNRVEKASKNREDLDVFGTEYMPLPLDKNGEPWHAGDRMFVPRDGVCKVLAVGKFGVVAVGREGSYWYSANSYSHYKEPTVEDVLMELIDEACDGDSSPDDETIAKYAAKLRLKED